MKPYTGIAPNDYEYGESDFQSSVSLRDYQNAWMERRRVNSTAETVRPEAKKPVPPPELLTLLPPATLQNSRHFASRAEESYLWPMATRATYNTGSGAEGGLLVASEILAPQLVRQPTSLTERLPLNVRLNCVADFTIPVQDGEAIGYTVGEGNDVAQSEATFKASVAFTPTTVGCRGAATHRQLTQAPSTQALALNVAMNGLTRELDRHLLQGHGSNSPLGVLSDTAIPTETEALSQELLAKLEARVLAANGDTSRMAWVVSPDTLRQLRSLPVAPDSEPILSRRADELLGRPLLVSSLCPTDRIVIADWSAFVMAVWGAGVSVLANPYGAGWASGTVELRLLIDIDMSPVRSELFAVGNLTG